MTWINCLARGLFIAIAIGGAAWLATGSARAETSCDPQVVNPLKQALLAKAESFQGQGDPDGSKQAQLDPLVNALLAACPQPPVRERIPLLVGAWQQVWGPYTYRDDSRGVDPSLDPHHIYQVIFADNFYYNVSPDRDRRGRSKNRTVLLRGEYAIDPKHTNVLNVHFTRLKSAPGIPADAPGFVRLPAPAESKTLEGLKTILPSLFVRLFFGGGSLNEVYTDNDLRITYGGGNDQFKKNYLYVLKRVTP